MVIKRTKKGSTRNRSPYEIRQILDYFSLEINFIDGELYHLVKHSTMHWNNRKQRYSLFIDRTSGKFKSSIFGTDLGLEDNEKQRATFFQGII